MLQKIRVQIRKAISFNMAVFLLKPGIVFLRDEGGGGAHAYLHFSVPLNESASNKYYQHTDQN